MKQLKGFVTGIVLTVLAAALFQAGTVFASTGCFADTDGHWAETFICWLKDNGIAGGYGDGTFRPESAISRAEMAVMLQRTYTAANDYTDAQLGLPHATGEIVVDSGPGQWLINGPAGHFEVGYGPVYASISSPLADTGGLFMQYPNPLSGFNGRRLSVRGMDYCYWAGPEVHLVEVRLWNCTQGTAADPTCLPLVIDTQDKAEPGCLEYRFQPQPVDTLFVQAFAHWGPAGANRALSLSGIKLHLQPTDLPLAAPAAEQAGPASPAE